jgi:hypothetical protein
MLTLKNKTTTVDKFGGDVHTITAYDADGTVVLAGDGLWGAEAGRTVRVSAVSVLEVQYADEDYTSTMVNVEHNSTWDIYTDSAFEAAVSAALGLEVTFTEQGMQEDNLASMEV